MIGLVLLVWGGGDCKSVSCLPIPRKNSGPFLVFHQKNCWRQCAQCQRRGGPWLSERLGLSLCWRSWAPTQPQTETPQGWAIWPLALVHFPFLSCSRSMKKQRAGGGFSSQDDSLELGTCSPCFLFSSVPLTPCLAGPSSLGKRVLHLPSCEMGLGRQVKYVWL